MSPYILAPRSVYAFPLLPLSRQGLKWRYSIFPDLRDYLRKLQIYPRKHDIYLSLRTKHKPLYGLWAFGLRNRKWASSYVLGLFGPYLTQNVHYGFFDKNELSAVFIVKFD